MTQAGKVALFHIPGITKLGLKDPSHLPFSIKILLENALRNCDNKRIAFEDIKKIADWSHKDLKQTEVAFYPGRVILQDFTGVPCVVDLAALRSAMKRLGGDYRKINPQIPCDLVIDHSVQIDAFGSKDAFDINIQKEFERNQERYAFLKWGQNAFSNFSVIPPATGIIHQINLEYLAKGVLTKKNGLETIAYPDSLVGTDSHTTMINGLGVLGWGVGGIEAEAVMLGEPINMLLPEVVGFKLDGKLNNGVTATDLVLTIVEILRKKGVVGKFVEYFGEGLKTLSLPDRATISNMGPEYGATVGYMPIDEETLHYYKATGRDEKQIDLIERYMKEQGLFYSYEDDKQFSEILELDLSTVIACCAGPKRPQDRIALESMKSAFEHTLKAPVKEGGFGLDNKECKKRTKAKGEELSHGAVVLASITSCTNTSNPSLLIGAGLMAKKAVEKRLKVKPYVKTSFVPGSQVADDYLKKAGLIEPLEALGFHIVGYGCATCIGNSGPLEKDIADAIEKNNLIAVSVLSGNRNFEGRINPFTKANYLASPMLVVAYALAGRVDIDWAKDPIGKDKKSNDVFLKDIWPSNEEINAMVEKHVTVHAFNEKYKHVFEGNKKWKEIQAKGNSLFEWSEKSTYIQEPPFFVDLKKEVEPVKSIKGARVLVMVGNSITTDHISPAGPIAEDSPAGIYLKEQGVKPVDFNSYGSRRGNDRVMTRGTFANIRLRNLIAPGTEGSWTIHFPTNQKMSIYDASLKYKKEGTPLIVLAGKEYGTGSSRDWAAKGTALLGIKVVIAESYERIHRSNLAGMGILPLQFKKGLSVEALGIQGDETFDFQGIDDNLKPQQDIMVVVTDKQGNKKKFLTTSRLDTPAEIDYFRNGGILQSVLRKML